MVLESDPQLLLHVTAVLVVLPTVALKDCVPPVNRLTAGGATEIVTGAVTVTVAWADLDPSAELVAVTVQVVGEPGAV